MNPKAMRFIAFVFSGYNTFSSKHPRITIFFGGFLRYQKLGAGNLCLLLLYKMYNFSTSQWSLIKRKSDKRTCSLLLTRNSANTGLREEKNAVHSCGSFSSRLRTQFSLQVREEKQATCRKNVFFFFYTISISKKEK